MLFRSIESFPYVIKHKKGKDNVIADALSRHYTMLSQLDFKIFGLETIREQYIYMMSISKMCCRIVKKGELGTNSSSMMICVPR